MRTAFASLVVVPACLLEAPCVALLMRWQANLNATSRKFLGLITVETTAYDPESHRVAFALHICVAILAALGIAIISCVLRAITRDPLDSASQRKKRLAERIPTLHSPLNRRRSTKKGLADAPNKPVIGQRVTPGAAADNGGKDDDAAPSLPPSPPSTPPPSSPHGVATVPPPPTTWWERRERQLVVDVDSDELLYQTAPVLPQTAPALSPPPSPPSADGAGLTARILREQRPLGISSADTPLGDAAADVVSGSKEKMKILITHFQITSSFKYNMDLDLDWPEIDVFNEWFSWVNLDLIDLSRLECIQPLNFYDGLFSTVLSATLILVAVPLTCYSILALQSLSWRLGLQHKTAKAQRVRRSFVDRSWNLFLMLCFFFFPPVSKRVFNTLHCAKVTPDQSFMWADLYAACHPP